MMFHFWRNFKKSAKEQQQERLNAYLDNALPAAERPTFEQELAQDEALQAQLAQLRRLKIALGQLPPLPLPRMFTLDPAQYGRPQRFPAGRVYPILRLATAMTAFFFVLTLTLTLFSSQSSPSFLADQTGDRDELQMEEETSLVASAYPTELVMQESAGGDMAAEAPAGESEPQEIPAPAIEPTPEPLSATGNAVTDTQNDGMVSQTPSMTDLNPRPTASPTIDSLRANPTATPTASPSPTALPPSEPTQSSGMSRSIPFISWFAIGLGLGFTLLLGATLIVRRRL